MAAGPPHSLREEDDRRRDVAMHAKLDELLRAEKYARKELAGIEELEAEEIAALKLRLAELRPDDVIPNGRSELRDAQVG
jgi:low affinity Fe/Cu permease